MIYLGKFCCVCLDPGQELEKLLTIQESISYYDKLSILIPELNINRIKKIAFICNDCRKCTDDMFNFRKACLRNNNRLHKYISQLCLDKNDIDNITSELIIVKQKVETVNDNLCEYKSVIYLNDNFLQYENNFITECERENVIKGHVKQEMMDDDVADQYKLQNMSENDKTKERNTDVGFLSKTNENVINLMDGSNNADNRSYIKHEVFDDNFSGKYETQFENVSITENINTMYEMNVDGHFLSKTYETIKGSKDPLEINTNIECNESFNDTSQMRLNKLSRNNVFNPDMNINNVQDNLSEIYRIDVNMEESTDLGPSTSKHSKYCLVPVCTSTSIRNPNKIFISLPAGPKQMERRSLWLKAMRRNEADISLKSRGFVCEDHFNLEKDMKNYLKWKLMGGKIYLKEDVVPHIFPLNKNQDVSITCRKKVFIEKDT